MSPQTGPGPEVTPLVVDAADVAALLKISVRHVHRLDTLGHVPEPIRLGRAVRWNAAEIREWIAAGAPPRSRWNLRSALGADRTGEQGR